MSLNKIQLICELLTEQMNHWILFPAALVIMEMTRGQTGMQKPDLMLWILCSLFPLLFFILRTYHVRKQKKRYLFLLWHLAAAAGLTLALLLVPRSFVGRMLCILCGAGYMLQSMVLMLKKELRYTVAIQLPAGVALSLIASIMRQTNQWNAYYSFSLIAVIGLFFIVFYMRQYLDYMTLNRGSAGNLPIGEIFHSGAGLVLAYTLFSVTVLVISTQFEWLAKLLKPVTDLFLQFLRFLLSKLIHPEDAAEEELTTIEEEARMIGDPQLPEPKGPFWIWQALQILFTVALLAALAFLALKLLMRLIRLLQEYLNRRMARQYAQDEETFDLREKCEPGKPAEKKRQSLGTAFTNKERIRRLYKRRLPSLCRRREAKERERSRLELLTAREWEKRLETDGMASVYEKARYSLQDVTAEDVRQMREACSERNRNRQGSACDEVRSAYIQGRNERL